MIDIQLQNLKQRKLVLESFGNLSKAQAAEIGLIEGLIFKAEIEPELEKGKKAGFGEIREWKGGKFQRTTQGWVPVDKHKPESGQEAKVAARTSSGNPIYEKEYNKSKIAAKKAGAKIKFEDYKDKGFQDPVRNYNDDTYITIKQTLAKHHEGVSDSHATKIYDELRAEQKNESSNKENKIKKSEDNLYDILKGGKQGIIGEVREWSGKKYRKQANGKWLEVSEHGMTKSQHRTEATRRTPLERVKHNKIADNLSDKEHSDEEVGLKEKKSSKSSEFKKVKFPEEGSPTYFVVDQNGDDYKVVEEDSIEAYKKHKGKPEEEYYAEWIPKSEFKKSEDQENNIQKSTEGKHWHLEGNKRVYDYDKMSADDHREAMNYHLTYKNIIKDENDGNKTKAYWDHSNEYDKHDELYEKKKPIKKSEDELYDILKGGKVVPLGTVVIRKNGVKEKKTAKGWEYLGKVKMDERNNRPVDEKHWTAEQHKEKADFHTKAAEGYLNSKAYEDGDEDVRMQKERHADKAQHHHSAYLAKQREETESKDAHKERGFDESKGDEDVTGKSEVITDHAERQKLKNAIQEGELILRAGTSNGKKMSKDELSAVQRSVDNAKKKLAKEKSDILKDITGKENKFADWSKLSGVDVLKKLDLQDTRGYYKQGKRSQIFDRQTSEMLSDNKKLIEALKKIPEIKFLGYDVEVTQSHYNSKPEQHEIQSEREWSESKGSEVFVTIKKNGKQVGQFLAEEHYGDKEGHLNIYRPYFEEGNEGEKLYNLVIDKKKA